MEDERIASMLVGLRQLMKLYEMMLKECCEDGKLSQTEIRVLSFLKNNPDRDTAAEISEFRMLPKGNVSQAVDSLIQKGFLESRQDTDDRRRKHLRLTDQVNPLAEQMEVCRKKYMELLYQNFSEEEYRSYQELTERILKNVKTAMEKRQAGKGEKETL